MPAFWNRRTFLKTTAVAGAAGLCLPRLARTEEAPKLFDAVVAPFVEVETAQGRVRGGQSRGALAFKGIPYGGSVSGAGRFKEAPPPPTWTGVRDATRLGPPAIQTPKTSYGENEPPYSEDCLVLNVWTPAVGDGRKRPVMLYSHGGGYTTGSGGHRGHDGGRFAATYDVVFVATNHRLGLLGYLYLGELGGEEYATSGNQSMLDIVAGLRWIKRNIEAFGGDPDNVMILGESGGGFKTGTLMAMPAAHGLFHKASIESGAPVRRIPKEKATETALKLLKSLDISRDALHKLNDVPAETFVGMTPGDVGPVVDGTVLPTHPFDPVAPALSAHIPLIVGCGRDEATFFFRENPETFHMDDAAMVARLRGGGLGADVADHLLAAYRKSRPQATPVELYIAILTAQAFGADTIKTAERKSMQPAPVFAYRYDYPSNTPIPGTDWTLRAGHATDITVLTYNDDIPDLEGNGPGLHEAAKNMSAYWAGFAHHGRPGGPGLPAWPAYDVKQRATMLIDTKCTVAKDPYPLEREAWKDI